MRSTLATVWIARPAPTSATSSSSRRHDPPGPTAAASGPTVSQAAVVWSSSSGRSIGPQPTFSSVPNLSFLNSVTRLATMTSPWTRRPPVRGRSANTSSGLSVTARLA